MCLAGLSLACFLSNANASTSRLCMPCIDDMECVSDEFGEADLTCVQPANDGAFCLPSCQPDCPEGYFCDQSVSGSHRCLPQSGVCPCSLYAIEVAAETDCWIENQWGLCVGTRVCTPFGVSPCSASVPAPEICNGWDDDCDGAVDEGELGDDCLTTSNWGVCLGTYLCVAGASTCVGPMAEPELCDGIDNNCNGIIDEGWLDWDGDGLAVCVDPDDDGDFVNDYSDNCINVPNTAQSDFDGDGEGDLCDGDDDNDTWEDVADCQPMDPDRSPGAQEVCNGLDDNCNGIVDEGFADFDWDGNADCVDWDDDNDSIADPFDCQPLDLASFPGAPEECDGLDNDCDGIVDNGLPDADKDGIPNCSDPDADGDDVPDHVDNCPYKPNSGQEDLDGDELGDMCDTDAEGDGVPIATDNCFTVFNPGQSNIDGDSPGDSCDTDDDGDSVLDTADNCPASANKYQEDADGDGVGDACDDDDDNDGLPDAQDCYPLNSALPFQTPEQCNGIDDDCDQRIDEGFPDFDMDGTPDCADLDDDNDGDPDSTDCEPLNPAAGHPVGEQCNGVDDNCDGNVDEGQPYTMCGTGVCSHTTLSCKDGKAQFCNPFLGSTTELCDGQDNDCDGLIDEGFVPGTPCQAGQGECAAIGLWVCTPDGSGVACSATELPSSCAGKECGADGCGGICGVCDDGIACTDDTCEGGTCQSQPRPGFCYIEGECVEAGAPAPGVMCKACIPTADTSQWSPAWDGTPCADGKVCHDGGCCNPYCGNKQCGSDLCGGSCGDCHTQWCVSPVCLSGYCQASKVKGGACLIEGHCYGAGEFENGNPCRWCAPEKSQTAWTKRTGTWCAETATCWYSTCCDHVEACANLECGTGTCGKVPCGDCDCGSHCVGGQCLDLQSGCRQCGDDGCGGECGQCPSGQECVDGFCAPLCPDGIDTAWGTCTQGVCAEFAAAPSLFNSQDAPAVTSLSNGGHVVAWSGGSLADISGVSYQVYDSSGNKVQMVRQANTHFVGKQDSVAVCSLPLGFLAAWRSIGYGYQEPAQDGSFGGIYGRLVANDGTPLSDEFQMHVAPSGDQASPSVGCFEDGGFMVAWRDTAFSSYSIEVARFDANGIRQGSEIVLLTGPKSLGISSGKIAVLQDDTFAVTWYQEHESSARDVYVRRFSRDGDPLSEAIRVNTFLDYDQMVPDIAPTANGGFVVVWESRFYVSETSSQDGSWDGVVLRAFDGEGIPISDEVAANHCTYGKQNTPRVAAMPNGNIAVTWNTEPQTGKPVNPGPFLRLFDPLLQPLGTETRVAVWEDSGYPSPGAVTVLNQQRLLTVIRRWSKATDRHELFSRVFTNTGQPCCGMSCNF